MGTLFDALSAKLGGDPDQAPTAVAPQQDELIQGLRAKTGKATAGTTPAGSDLGEQAALGTAKTQQQQQTQQGRLAGTQVATEAGAEAQGTADAQAGLATTTKNQLGQVAATATNASAQTAATGAQASSQTQFDEQQKTLQMNASAYQQLQQLASDKQTTVDNIWRDYGQQQQDLAARQDQAQIEQTGFLLSLRDTSYVNELNRIGQERDLTDKISFNDESSRIALGDQLSQTVQQLGFQTDLNADQRTWDTKLASMDINAAMQISQAVISAGAQSQMISGAGTLAKGGVDAYFTPSSKTGQFDDNGEGKSNAIQDNGDLTNGGAQPDFSQNKGSNADASQSVGDGGPVT